MLINTFLPGGSPEDLETLVTNEIEAAVEDIEDIEFIHSTSYREHSSIVIKFQDDSDYKKRYDDVRLKMLSMAKNLPDEAEPPAFNFLDVNDWFPTISVNISDNHSNATLALVSEDLKTIFSAIEGVKEVKLSGKFTREFHIELAKDKLRHFGITLTQAIDAIKRANIQIPAGHAETQEGEFIIRVDEQFRNRNDVLSLIVRTDSDGSFISD